MRIMTTNMMLLLLVLLTQMTIIVIYTEAAAIEPSTAEPASSVTNVTDESDHDDTEDESDTAATTEEEGHEEEEEEEDEEEEEERHDAGGSNEQKHEDKGSDHHEDKGSDHHEDKGSDHHEDKGSDHHEEQHGNHWNYHEDNGPEKWSSMHKECQGRYQSPINIEMESTKLNEHLTEISFLVHNASGDKITISNNGHSVNFAYDHATMRLDGGSYDHTYRVAGVHFHWGSDDLEGSEHMIQGKHFPLEMHVVSYDEDDFNSVGEATASRDGIAVLGVLFTVSEDDNVHFDPLISHLKDVRDPDDPVSLEYLDLEKLLPLNRRNYFRYSGSLTTPPCSESVIWTVFEDTQTISSKQLAEFRTLHETAHGKGADDDRLLHNWRPVQQTFKRVVYRSFPSLTAVSHLSSAKNNRIDDYQAYNTGTTSAVTAVCQRNIFIGWMTFYLVATML